jgi:hypothetical protein
VTPTVNLEKLTIMYDARVVVWPLVHLVKPLGKFTVTAIELLVTGSLFPGGRMNQVTLARFVLIRVTATEAPPNFVAVGFMSLTHGLNYTLIFGIVNRKMQII